MASGAFKAPDEAIWASLRRSTPDPRARSFIPAWRFKLLTNTCSFLVRVFVVPFYLPIWIIRYLLHPRPFPEWTWRNMLFNRIGRLDGRWNLGHLGPMDDSWSVPDAPAFYKEAIARGEVEVDFVKLEPVIDSMRKGVAVHPAIKGDVRAGVMISPTNAVGQGLEAAKQGEKVFCHVHGGGFVKGFPLWQELPLETAKSTGLRFFSIDYRKTISADTAFPAPLIDALSGYLYLVNTLHFEPRNIILCGESAGGHVALMLARYLSQLDLPLPGYISAMAPWSDLTLSFPSYITLDPWDTLDRVRLAQCVRDAARWYDEEALKRVEFSPALHGAEAWAFLKEGGVKVYVYYGSRELFRDEVVKVAGDMKSAGVDVRVREDVDGLHTPIGDPRRRGMYIKDLQAMIDG